MLNDVGGALLEEYYLLIADLEQYLVDPSAQFPHCLPVFNALNAIGWVLYATSPEEAGVMWYEASETLDLLNDESDRVSKGAIGQLSPAESRRGCTEIYDGFNWPETNRGL